MINNGKGEPRLRPRKFPSLKENLDLAIGDPGVRRKLKVVLRISGGAPTQGYRFEFRASGQGTAQCELNCTLSGRRGKASTDTLKSDEFTGLLKTIRKSKILHTLSEQPLFLPDTVVGCLEISDAESTYRIYFVADAEQAIAQGKVPHVELTRVVNKIYALGGKLMGKRSVKP